MIVPVHPGTFTTPTLFTQHAPTFSPRTQFAWSHGTTLAGCHQTPNASTTEATWARYSACREPLHPMTTTRHPWADGWELLVKCAGVVSIPGHAQNTHRAHHQAPLSAQGHCVVVVPGCHGSLQTESQPAGSQSTQKTTHFIHHFQSIRMELHMLRAHSPTYA